MRARTIIHRTIAVLLVIVVLLSSLYWFGYVLKIKRSDGVTTMQNLYSQKANSCDVLFLGSSHVGMNLDAEVFWNDYGIPTYVLWGSKQPFWNSYYFMLEALKTQTPKVIVLDTLAATYDFDYSDNARQETNTVGMRLNLNKIHAISVSAPKDRWTDMLLEFPLYHSRIQDLSMDDFAHFPWSKGLENNKGTGVRYGVGSYQLEDASAVSDVAKIHEKEEQYLLKIIEACKTKDIPLVLIKTPTVQRISQQPFYNRVKEIADSCDLPFINMNLMDQDLGIDASDFWTDGHLNTNGARKISAWLAEYLQEKYELEDHRGDGEYSSWDVFSDNIRFKYIKGITDITDYVRELKHYDYSIAILKNSSWETNDAYKNLLEDLEQINIPMDELMSSAGGNWLLTGACNGELVYQPLTEMCCEYVFDDSNFKIGFKDGIGVQINGEKVYSLRGPGIILVVYDREANRCVDVVDFLLGENFSLSHQ